MASGHTAVSDKVASEVFKMHIHTPHTLDLDTEFDDYFGHCSDMGTELGMASFKVEKGVSSLLPPCIERGSMPLDVDNVDDDGDGDVPDGCASDDDLGLDMDNDGDVPSASAPPAPVRPIPKAQRPPSEFMQNAYITAGIQHTSNNINEDSNNSMPHFDSFFKQLKECEALLRSPDRRRRFVWTHLRKTRYARLAPLFDTFAAHIYEDRWHEVVNFLKKSKKQIGIIAQLFDAKKFASGLDADNQQDEAAVAAARRRERKEAQQGVGEFDPIRFERFIKKAFFHHYSNMVYVLDQIPLQFAMDMERCPCHGELLAELDKHQSKKVLEAHYGKGISVCPMSGKGVPDLSDGGVERVLKKLLDLAEASTHPLPHWVCQIFRCSKCYLL
jgi:hypothetical protein